MSDDQKHESYDPDLYDEPQLHEVEELDDYRGLFWREPWMALIFTAMLLSLAGIPLTIGFIGNMAFLITN